MARGKLSFWWPAQATEYEPEKLEHIAQEIMNHSDDALGLARLLRFAPQKWSSAIDAALSSNKELRPWYLQWCARALVR